MTRVRGAVLLLLLCCCVVEGRVLQTLGAFQGLTSDLWPTCDIPYTVTGASKEALKVLNEGISMWTGRVTGLTFRSRQATDGNDYISFRFEEMDGGSATRKKPGVVTVVRISKSNPTAYVVAHEIGHALGMPHEHQRMDRDENIKVHLDRVDPDRKHNFGKAALGMAIGPYNYGSVMHYGNRLWQKAGETRDTIEAPRTLGLSGSRLSDGDVRTAEFLYGRCQARYPSTPDVEVSVASTAENPRMVTVNSVFRATCAATSGLPGTVIEKHVTSSTMTPLKFNSWTEPNYLFTHNMVTPRGHLIADTLDFRPGREHRGHTFHFSWALTNPGHPTAWCHVHVHVAPEERMCFGWKMEAPLAVLGPWVDDWHKARDRSVQASVARSKAWFKEYSHRQNTGSPDPVLVAELKAAEDAEAQAQTQLQSSEEDMKRMYDLWACGTSDCTNPRTSTFYEPNQCS